MPTNKTAAEATAAFRTIIQGRGSTAPLAVEAWKSPAQTLLTATKATVQSSLGVCRYTIDGQDFAIANITQAECTDLGGDFTPNVTTA
jgi:hypothetical protein